MKIFTKFYFLLKKEAIEQTSYRFSYVLELCSIFFGVAVFYFIAQLFGESAASHLQRYRGDYFSFVLIGIAFSGFIWTGLHTFSQALRQEQVTGTLEALLVTPTPIAVILLSKVCWRFLMNIFRFLVYLAMGSFLFDAHIEKANWGAFFIVLLLSVVVCSSLGMLSASFVLVFKRGDPINWFIGHATHLLSGVYYPISVLPSWVRVISYFIPITYSLSLSRDALLRGTSILSMGADLLKLVALLLFLFPLSLFCLSFALKVTKREGTLAFY